MHGLVWIVSLAALFTVQQTPQSDVTERVEVDYVLVDVIAYDKNDRPVAGLTVDDFVVRENGKPVKIDSFEALDLFAPVDPADTDRPPRVRATESARSPGVGAPSRYIVAIDFEFSRDADTFRALQVLETFVEGLAPNPAVEYLLHTSEAGTLTDGFVSDPARLARLLADYRRRLEARARERPDWRASSDRRTTGFGGTGQRQGSGGDGSLEDLEERFEECAFAFRNRAMSRGEFAACIFDELRLFTELQQARASLVLEELQDLVTRFDFDVRPNTILFVAPGLPLRPGQAAARLATAYLEGETEKEMGPTSAESGFLTPPPVAQGEEIEEEFEAFLRECRRRRIIFHTLDIYNYDLKGRRTSSPRFRSGGSRVMTAYRDLTDELQEGLVELAARTGGRFSAGPDPQRIRDAYERTRHVYVLGYPAPKGDADFRRIRVKCKRKGVKLLHRDGYVPRGAS